MKYFFLTIRHKWFVFIAGRKIGVPLLRLIKHDWSKFMPSELPHYQRQFFGKADDPLGFIICWIRHQNRHEHHWEYWIPRTGHNRCNPPYPDNKPIPMPINAIKEMAADWLGASRAYEGQFPKSLREWGWFNGNFKDINIHTETRTMILKILSDYFFLVTEF